ncbi:MBL fold metallo-hydrolase RNA specificity domain-containing protein [Maridesulfovibrio zosterae]|uniref:MBL fold metallo-hydrolase RNA specificity domain-containing protein n=1 Tax=Maridesulfovibrio zosterae TaxID=82171 RepID=UPI00040A3C57|nr:MBL fold metallo-hydrolase [Maridesulfovibrio zosterae]
MKITFMGAAKTVTGSCYIIETDKVRFAVDCGLHQGNAEIEKRNRAISDYRPKELDFILITHAHIDHTGLLPAAVRHGFSGPIYMTQPTRDLLDIMLLDSAFIQEMETEWANRKRLRKGLAPINPIYEQEDAAATVPMMRTVQYGATFEPAEGITVSFRDAGHILGSAFIELWVKEGGETTKVVFSGDLGHKDQLIVRNPSIIEKADYLLMESTYGDRNHKDASNSLAELAEAIKWSYSQGGKVVIPAFAVERSQQLIYSLRLLYEDGRLPKDMPVYLDSPLAIRATEVFRNHPEFFDLEAKEMLHNGDDPLSLPSLKFTLDTESSQAINNTDGPAVIISASGMANAGRIKHHLRHNIWKKNASIVFVGYQGVGSPGRRIVNGADNITIFGEKLKVEAKIFTINGFSGHAGQDEMIEWLKNFDSPAMKVILTHGEPKGQKVLSALIKQKLGYKVHIADYREELMLVPGGEIQPVTQRKIVQQKVDWDYLLKDSEHLFVEFRDRLDKVKEQSFINQTELRDKLLDINRQVIELISEL